MKVFIPLYIFVLLLLGCNNQPSNDLFKTTDGEYASRMGKFVAAYPSKPFHHISRRKIDEESDFIQEFHLIRSTFGDYKVFSVEYFELDEKIVSEYTTEELLEIVKSDIDNFLYEADFVPGFINQTKLQGSKALFFSYQPNPKLAKQIPTAKAEGKAVIRNNRVYYMYYFGKIDRQAERFLESFRFTK